MNGERKDGHCKICGVVTGDDSTICAECESAFEPFVRDESEVEKGSLDLEAYHCRMFPWEQSRNGPQLIISNAAWVILALVLVVIVVLLALTRAPLPSCWEVS
jgi:hypothetical protein